MTRNAAYRVVALTALLTASTLKSQTASGNTRLDLSAGVSYGGGGVVVRDQRFGTAASGAVTHRWRTGTTRDHWLGVTGRRTRVIDNADDCQGVPGECLARNPTLRSIALMAGVGMADGTDAGWRPMRVFAGPSHVWADEADGSLGADGRVDVWLMRRRFVSLTLVLETSVVPRWRGATCWTGSAGLDLGTRWETVGSPTRMQHGAPCGGAVRMHQACGHRRAITPRRPSPSARHTEPPRPRSRGSCA
jgi:hypothetical protein